MGVDTGGQALASLLGLELTLSTSEILKVVCKAKIGHRKKNGMKRKKKGGGKEEGCLKIPE